MAGRYGAAWVIAVVALAGCAERSEPDPAPGSGLAPVTDGSVAVDSQASPPPVALPERPASLMDTVMIEGMAHVEAVRLVSAPEAFAVPFTTYVPDGIAVEFEAEHEIDWVRFNAAFADSVDERAFMMVRIYPAGTTRLQVEDAVREFVTGRAPGMDATAPMDAPAWAEWATRLSYSRSLREMYFGSVVVGRHGPRFFEVLRLYPAEYGDGLGPRLGSILRHWRWEDTGESLTG